MEGHVVCARCALLTVVICSSWACDAAKVCSGSDAISSACHASAERVTSVVVANYATEQNSEEEEQEENVNDADLVLHMQMRMTVDMPHAETTELSQQPAKHAAVQKRATPWASLPATGPYAHQMPARDMWTPAPGVGSDILLSLLIGALLAVTGTLLVIVARSFSEERKIDQKAADKVWILDWAVVSDPEKKKKIYNEGSSPMVQLYSKPEKMVQMHSKPEKIIPRPIDNDSSDTDEDEPEAESESEQARELEEAVFQAAQVEVANEAGDDGYGEDREVKLADQIRVI